MRFWIRVGVAVLAAVTVAGGVASGAPAEPVRVKLPAPTGRQQIGTVSMHLVDRSRPDPWVPAQPNRELMVSVFYPARDADSYPRERYLPPGAAGYLADALAAEWQVPKGNVDPGAIRGHGRRGAPADLRTGRRPVLLFSPGHLATRALNTTLVEDLASRGYVVVTIDHTYETAVDFPHGRLEQGRVPLPDPQQPDLEGQVIEFNRSTIAARVADTRTVLDQLSVLAGGGNPDAGRRPLPRGLSQVLDLSRVGMFGHSGGGATTAESMYYDPRIKAGAVVDSGLGYDFSGEVLPPVATEGLDRPVLLFSSEEANPIHTVEPSIASFWAHQRGWKRDLLLRGANHVSFADYEPFLPQLVAAGAVDLRGQEPQEYLEDQLGPIPPREAVDTARAYLRAFFDLHLRDRPTRLFDGPSARYPSAELIP